MSISRYVAAVSSSYVEVLARSPAHVSQEMHIKARAAGPIFILHSRPFVRPPHVKFVQSLLLITSTMMSFILTRTFIISAAIVGGERLHTDWQTIPN